MTAVDTPADAVESTTPRPPVGLWVVCLLVGAAVLVMWAAGRFKPLVVYSLMMGTAAGGWASLVGGFCHVPRQVGLMWLTAVVALAATAGGILLAAQRHAAEVKPANPLAERLLRQFEQQTNSAAATEPPPFWMYLRKRYQTHNHITAACWLVAEAVLSSVAAVGITAIAWRTSSPNKPAG